MSQLWAGLVPPWKHVILLINMVRIPGGYERRVTPVPERRGTDPEQKFRPPSEELPKVSPDTQSSSPRQISEQTLMGDTVELTVPMDGKERRIFQLPGATYGPGGVFKMTPHAFTAEEAAARGFDWEKGKKIGE